MIYDIYQYEFQFKYRKTPQSAQMSLVLIIACWPQITIRYIFIKLILCPPKP